MERDGQNEPISYLIWVSLLHTHSKSQGHLRKRRDTDAATGRDGERERRREKDRKGELVMEKRWAM